VLAALANTPPGLVVILRIRFKSDGSLASAPEVVNRNPHPLFQTAAESAVQAVRRCAPFNFLPADKFESWKEIELNFDPRMMGGASH